MCPRIRKSELMKGKKSATSTSDNAKSDSTSQQDPKVSESQDYEQISIFSDVHTNVNQMKQILGDSPDLISKEIHHETTSLSIVYFKSLTNEEIVEKQIIKPLMDWENSNTSSPVKDIETVKKHMNVSQTINEATDYAEVIDAILDGQVILFTQQQTIALLIPSIPSQMERNVESPKLQTVVWGPQDGFIEDINTNLALIRKRIRNPKLRFESFTVGKESKTQVMVAYLEHLVEQDVLSTVRERIQAINKNSILESSMVEELIEDRGYTPFPTIKSIERPDTVAGELLEGKVGVLVNGSPLVLIAPSFFTSFFQASEDYYARFDLATMVRFIRLIAFWLSIALPATYIAITTFHAELLETNILINLAAQREGVPFPAFMEVLIMEILFELLREAGIRMPRSIGSAISIVGALVIGEAAVSAGFISPAMVIIVSLTAIASFISPYYGFSGGARFIRFIVILFASIGGFFGMMIFLIAFVIHLNSVTSIGKPYLYPVSPFRLSKQKDVLLRMPLWWNETKTYNTIKQVIQKFGGNGK